MPGLSFRSKTERMYRGLYFYAFNTNKQMEIIMLRSFRSFLRTSNSNGSRKLTEKNSR